MAVFRPDYFSVPGADKILLSSFDLKYHPVNIIRSPVIVTTVLPRPLADDRADRSRPVTQYLVN